MEPKYYLKSGLGRMAAIESLGRAQPVWLQVGPDEGVAAVVDATTIERLDECVKRGWGGVKPISKEEFEEKKSNPSPVTPRRKVTTHPETEKPRLMAERMFPQKLEEPAVEAVPNDEGGGSSPQASQPIATSKTPTAGKVARKQPKIVPPPE